MCKETFPAEDRVAGVAVELQAGSLPQLSVQGLLMNEMHFLTRRGF